MIRLSRKKKLFFNIITSLVYQILLIISGFILPRSMLSAYGSEINGLVSSISQFLSFISFMQAGVGVVVQAALYKPLSEDDYDAVSKIYVSAQKFFRTIAIIFVGYTLTIAFVYPYFTNTPFSNQYIALLVFAISINLFAQYFFGLTNSMLLQADQKAYVSLILQSISTVLNVVVSLILIYSGFSVLIVKLVSNIVCLISPLGMYFYVRKNYKIDTHIKYTGEPIKQKWSGFAQHISAVIVDNTDMVTLTLFSSLSNVSVYYVYYIVVNALKVLLTSLTNGIQSLFGNMIARNENQNLKRIFDKFEMLFSYAITFLYTCALCLIVNFVKVYTNGVTDANYDVPVFAVLITMAFAVFCYRTIYYTLIKAAGHFKQTQFAAIFEAILNVSISVILVIKWDLIGVAIGTLIAVTYRTVYCVWYLSKNILKRPQVLFWKNMGINLIVYCVCYLLTMTFDMGEISYFSWFILAVKVAIVVFIILTVVYLLVYRKDFIEIRKSIDMLRHTPHKWQGEKEK